MNLLQDLMKKHRICWWSFHNAGKTLITITHNRQLAETIGTRFACMNEEHELKMLS